MLRFLIFYLYTSFVLAAEENLAYYDAEEQRGGVYNFNHEWVNVRAGPLYLDKSRFINHFYEKEELMVIHAPPRFGKTSNLELLQMFFEVPVDEGGTVLKFYVREKRQFLGELRCCKDGDRAFCQDHIASHPVIYLDFEELDVEDLETFSISMRLMISDLFRNHAYLANSPQLKRDERTIFDEDRHPDGHPLLRERTYANGGLHLSRLLHKHFNNSCVVLIDNYDAPASKFIIRGSKDNTMSEVFKILEVLMTGLLQDNKFVSHALLTGASSVGNVYTKHINRLKYYSIFENTTLSEFYGLKLRDVEKLLRRYSRQAWFEDAQRTYDGYYSLAAKEKMYAIRSFSKFMEKRGRAKDFKPIPILLQLSELFKYKKFGETIEKTLEKVTSIGRKVSFFTEHDIENLHLLVSKPKNQLDKSVATEHLMLQFLQENGCYTIISKNDNLCSADLIVPNQEIKKLLGSLLYTGNYFVEKFKVTRKEMRNYANSIIKLNCSEESFQRMLSAIRALFEKVLPDSEREFRAPFHSIPKFKSCVDSFLQVDNEVLGPNKTTIDTLIVRKDKTLIIFEFRFDRDSALIALSDVVSKKKYEVRTEEKPFNTILVGFYFNKIRNCSVSYLYNTFDIKKAVTMTVKME